MSWWNFDPKVPNRVQFGNRGSAEGAGPCIGGRRDHVRSGKLKAIKASTMPQAQAK